MTRDIPHGSKSKSHGSQHVFVGRFDGPWSLVLFPGYRVVWFFLPVLFAAVFCGMRAKMRNKPQPTRMAN